MDIGVQYYTFRTVIQPDMARLLFLASRRYFKALPCPSRLRRYTQLDSLNLPGEAVKVRLSAFSVGDLDYEQRQVTRTRYMEDLAGVI